MRTNLAQNADSGIYSNETMAQNAELAGSIAASCITKINSRYYLLIENEINALETAIRSIIAIRLADDQARNLLNTGIERCDISDSIPTQRQGFAADFKGVLAVENQAFLVFDTFATTSNYKHHILLVSAPICPIVDGAV